MNEYGINAIGNIRIRPRVSPACRAAQSQPAGAAQSQSGVTASGAVRSEAARQPVEKKAEKPAPAPSPASDVFLRFQVDEDTRDVTVYVVDRASKRVLRSIPPEDVTN